MKKKFKFLLLISVIFLSGCGASKDSNILDKLDDKLEDANSYYISGNMEIINNEDTYTYDVEVSYKKGDYYKVNLVNKLNNHEQVILRNDDGVYVITPSLNKSYKFQSDWPYNNSQVYLLSSVIDDLEDDENRTFKNNDNGYLFTSLVNFPNNKSLVKQNVYIDKKMNVTKVEVVDAENNVGISMEYKEIEYNKKFADDYFELSSILKISDKEENNSEETDDKVDNNTDNTNNMDSTNTDTSINNNSSNDSSANNNSNTNNNSNSNSNTTSEDNNSTSSKEIENKTSTEQTATIEDIIYPMYLPDNTYLTNQQTIDTDTGQRLILTFEGDSSFILVEETASVNDNGIVIPVSGDIEFLTDVVGVVGDNSISWDSNGIEYYIVSDTIPTSELIEIAQSISVLPVSK